MYIPADGGMAPNLIIANKLGHMLRGGCQNYGPFLGTLNFRCRIKIGIQKGTIILTTTHTTAEFRLLLTCGLGMSTAQSPPGVSGPWCELS